MGILEQVMQMRRENKSDEEIISSLRNQGISSPREINDALNHAQIKSAVSDIRGDDTPPSPQEEIYGGQEYAPEQQPPQGQVYTPQPQAYYPQQDYSSYGQQQEYYPQQTNTDAIVEISSQVFDEKVSEIAKKIDSAEEFRTVANARLEHLNERLKKIESVIDRIQSAVLEKVGAYGSGIESIKKEMSMMQDSFSKVVEAKIERKSPPSEEKQEKAEKVSRKKK